MYILQLKIKSLIAVGFLLLLNLNTHSINYSLTLDENSYNLQENLNDFIVYFEDTSKNLQINNIIIKDKSSFIKYNKLVKLEKDNIYWANFTLKNETNSFINKILTIGKKRHSDIADIYIFNNGKQIKHARSGHFLEYSKKEIKTELGSKFLIKLKPNEEYEIYIRIENISGFKPAFELKLEKTTTFYNNLSKRNLIFGMIQGILWIMFFYNLLIYVYNKDSVYIFYSLYVLGMILNIGTERGLFLEYIIPEFPKLNPFVFILATGLAIASYFQFLRLFLNTKKEMPKWNKALLVIIIINIVATVLLIANLAFWFNVPLAINGSNILNMLVLLIGLVFMAYLLKHRSSLALFFIIGTIFLVIGTVLNLFVLIGSVDFGFEAYHLMNIGIVGQILFFSLGLG